MLDLITISIDGQSVKVQPGTNVAAAISNHKNLARISVSGEQRAPVCGMGICYECRVTVDGVAQLRGCLVTCKEGMEVTTGE